MNGNHVVRIDIRTTGTDKAKRELRGLSGALERVGLTAERAKRGLLTMGVAAGAAAIGVVKAGDAVRRLETRSRVFATSQADANQKLESMIKIADRTRQPLESISEIYQRLAFVQSQKGFSNDVLSNMVENLAKFAAVSGNAQEATNALIQFSQALASDRLGGDELRSVREQMPQLAAAIAEAAGGSAADLKDLAAEGKLTADVMISAISEIDTELEARFSNVQVLFSETTRQIADAGTTLVGFLDKNIGASAALRDALRENVLTPVQQLRDTLLNGGPGATQFLENVKAGLLGIATAAGVLATVLAVAVAPAATAAVVALAPILGAAAAIGAAVAALYKYRDAGMEIGGQFISIGDAVLALWNAVKATATGIAQYVRDVAAGFVNSVQVAGSALEAMGSFVGAVFDRIGGVASAILTRIVSVARNVVAIVRSVITDLQNRINNMYRGVLLLVDALPLISVEVGDVDLFGGVNEQLTGFLDGVGNLASGLQTGFLNVATGIEGTFSAITDNMQNQLAGLAETISASYSEGQNLAEAFAAAGSGGSVFQMGGNPPAGGGGIPVYTTPGADEAIQNYLDIEDPVAGLFSRQFDERAELEKILEQSREKQAALGLNGETEFLLETAMLEQALEMMERRHELQLEEMQMKQDMIVMNENLLDGTLTLEEAMNGAAASMATGFANLARQVFNISGHIQQLTAMAINGLSNELTQLAMTGEMNLKRMARSLVQAIVQITMKLTIMLALVAAINAMGGGGLLQMLGMGFGMGGGTGATGATSAVAGGGPTLANPNLFAGASMAGVPFRAAGGPVYGGEPVLVGERGPELFVPPVSGSIKNNSTTSGMASQNPQVTIVNVDSTQNTLDALGSEEGEQIIMNVIQRNPEILRTIG